MVGVKPIRLQASACIWHCLLANSLDWRRPGGDAALASASASGIAPDSCPQPMRQRELQDSSLLNCARKTRACLNTNDDPNRREDR